eukprot:gene9890-13303_t
MGCTQSKVPTAEQKAQPTNVNDHATNNSSHNVPKGSATPPKDRDKNGAKVDEYRQSSSGKHLHVTDASVGFVIKTKRIINEDKIFINVYHHNNVKPTTFYVANGKLSKDKKDIECFAYSFLINSELYNEAIKNPDIKHDVCVRALEHINAQYGSVVEMSYKTPKMKRGFVGDDPETDFELAPTIQHIVSDTPPAEIEKEIESTANEHVTNEQEIIYHTKHEHDDISHQHSNELSSQPHDEHELKATNHVSDASHVTAAPVVSSINATKEVSVINAPPKMHGWLKKRGHVVMNWKTRYFVLDNGYLTYYVDKSDTPPYGKDVKGQICLIGYREIDLLAGNHNNESGSAVRKSISAVTSSAKDSPELLRCRLLLTYNRALFPTL